MFLSSGWWELWIQVIGIDLAIVLTAFGCACCVKMYRNRQ